MYSVVLMAALTTAPSAQTWHHHRCHGGYVVSQCSCYCSYSCGHSWGHGGGLYGYYGCYGCHSYPWYGSSCYSGYGYAGYPGGFQCHGCYGCYGGWSCYGMPVQQAFAEPAPPSGSQPPAPGERKTDKRPGKYEETPLPKGNKPGDEQVRAKVTIDLPVDAKLYIDGNLMKIAAGRRTFQTPDLIPGQIYYYELKAEIVRDGRVISANQRVILRPGEQATASFADLGKATDATAQAGQQ